MSARHSGRWMGRALFVLSLATGCVPRSGVEARYPENVRQMTNEPLVHGDAVAAATYRARGGADDSPSDTLWVYRAGLRSRVLHYVSVEDGGRVESWVRVGPEGSARGWWKMKERGGGGHCSIRFDVTDGRLSVQYDGVASQGFVFDLPDRYGVWLPSALLRTGLVERVRRDERPLPIVRVHTCANMRAGERNGLGMIDVVRRDGGWDHVRLVGQESADLRSGGNYRLGESGMAESIEQDDGGAMDVVHLWIAGQ